jgi:hypothetical protein
MRHITKLNDDKDVRFLARILICLVKKYHGDPTPFITKINVAEEVTFNNLKKLMVLDGMKNEADRLKLQNDLKKMLIYLGCSSKLSKGKRKALCDQEKLKELRFPDPTKPPDQASLDSLMENGLSRDKKKVIEDIARLLTILTGKPCELVGMKKMVNGKEVTLTLGSSTRLWRGVVKQSISDKKV